VFGNESFNFSAVSGERFRHCAQVIDAERNVFYGGAFAAFSIGLAFAEFYESHYLFKEHFCLVRRANEKGVVEGVVKFARLNYFVPVPEVADFDELNAFLETRCRENLARTLRGKTGTKAGVAQRGTGGLSPLASHAL
jgi:hypothetical protein